MRLVVISLFCLVLQFSALEVDRVTISYEKLSYSVHTAIRQVHSETAVKTLRVAVVRLSFDDVIHIQKQSSFDRLLNSDDFVEDIQDVSGLIALHCTDKKYSSEPPIQPVLTESKLLEFIFSNSVLTGGVLRQVLTLCKSSSVSVRAVVARLLSLVSSSANSFSFLVPLEVRACRSHLSTCRADPTSSVLSLSSADLTKCSLRFLEMEGGLGRTGILSTSGEVMEGSVALDKAALSSSLHSAEDGTGSTSRWASGMRDSRETFVVMSRARRALTKIAARDASAFSTPLLPSAHESAAIHESMHRLQNHLLSKINGDTNETDHRNNSDGQIDSTHVAFVELHSEVEVAKDPPGGIPGLGGMIKGIMEPVMKPVTGVLGDFLGGAIGGKMTDMMGQSITGGIVEKLPFLLVRPVTQNLTDNLTPTLRETVKDQLTETLTRSLKDYLTIQLTKQLTNEVTDRVESILGESLSKKINAEGGAKIVMDTTRDVGHVVSRSLTQAITGATLHTYYHGPGSQNSYYCFFCFHWKVYCEVCEYSNKHIYFAMFYAGYYSQYYSDYFSQYYTDTLKVLSREQMEANYLEQPYDENDTPDDNDEEVDDI
eukprot:GILK01005164.1.p1 GENE.GILK01005164.1~~GILK01005164.1.p1  ORF type:complete len:599 (+),score=77.76 GILK01005164.1:72-1868(+)